VYYWRYIFNKFFSVILLLYNDQHVYLNICNASLCCNVVANVETGLGLRGARLKDSFQRSIELKPTKQCTGEDEVDSISMQEM
jgi:hypothetical protein